MSGNRQGFTLFELVLVLAIVVIVGAIAYPSYQSLNGGFRVTAGADTVRAAWAQARARAIEDGVPYQFSIQPDSGRFRVGPDQGIFGAAGPGPGDDPGRPPLIREESVDGVSFRNPRAVAADNANGDPGPGNAGADGWVHVVTFMPDGTAREKEVELSLKTAGAHPLVLKLRGLTGVVTTRLE